MFLYFNYVLCVDFLRKLYFTWSMFLDILFLSIPAAATTAASTRAPVPAPRNVAAPTYTGCRTCLILLYLLLFLFISIFLYYYRTGLISLFIVISLSMSFILLLFCTITVSFVYYSNYFFPFFFSCKRIPVSHSNHNCHVFWLNINCLFVFPAPPAMTSAPPPQQPTYPQYGESAFINLYHTPPS